MARCFVSSCRKRVGTCGLWQRFRARPGPWSFPLACRRLQTNGSIDGDLTAQLTARLTPRYTTGMGKRTKTTIASSQRARELRARVGRVENTGHAALSTAEKRKELESAVWAVLTEKPNSLTQWLRSLKKSHPSLFARIVDKVIPSPPVVEPEKPKTRREIIGAADDVLDGWLKECISGDAGPTALPSTGAEPANGDPGA